MEHMTELLYQNLVNNRKNRYWKIFADIGSFYIIFNYIANVRKLSDILQDGFSGKRIVESISDQVKYIAVYNLI